MISWIFYALVVSAAVAASALAFEVAARALRLPRRAPWAAASVALVLLPLLVPLALSSATPADDPADAALALRLPAITITASDPATGTSTDALILIVLLGASAVALARFAVAHARLRRDACSWTAGQLDGVEVRFSESIGPAVTGWFRAAIVVPRWVAELDARQRGAIMSHELEHVRANDSLLLNVARLLLALMPWNPVAWLAYRRLQLAVELDCDRRVLARGADMPGYAETLLTVAQRTAVSTPALRVALAEPSSLLSRRITTMLQKPSRSPRLLATGGVAAGALLLAVACMTREPLGTSSAKPVQQAPRMVVSGNEEQTGQRTDQAYFEYQVEQPVTSMPGSSMPRYPDSLRTAGVEGEVLVQFVVDAEGRPEERTFKVLKANQEEFVLAIRAALPGMRFQAARKDGRAVRQLVQMPFMFKVAK
jgi:TonB family protein